MVTLNRPATPRARVALATRVLHPMRSAHAIGGEAVAYAVHGVMVFVAIVGATYVADYPAARMLLLSSGAVVLFWVAHVYAATLAHGRVGTEDLRAELETLRFNARRMLPLLEACVAPALPLVLAMLGILPLTLAYAASVTTGVATLAGVGWFALRNRHASRRRSLAFAVTTGGLGAAIIAAETFWH